MSHPFPLTVPRETYLIIGFHSRTTEGDQKEAMTFSPDKFNKNLLKTTKTYILQLYNFWSIKFNEKDIHTWKGIP